MIYFRSVSAHAKRFKLTGSRLKKICIGSFLNIEFVWNVVTKLEVRVKMFMTESCVCDAVCWCRYWLCINTSEHVHHRHILVQGDLSEIPVHSWCTLSHYRKFSHHVDIEWSSSKYEVCVCNAVYTVTSCLTQFFQAWVWLHVTENNKIH